MSPWLRDLRHDLLKHALWYARDLRDAGGPPTPADVRALRRAVLELRDGEGAQVSALGLWRTLRPEAEADGVPAGRLDAFEAAVRTAEQAIRALGDRAAPEEILQAVDQLLALEGAFQELAADPG
jgi:hypothetical protein